ncbi:hypothetical protein NX059_012208 [Plenodomus lindquistii]|nr:hypothetical protein NX059_012208 [Plenodomus lindquistii]
MYLAHLKVNLTVDIQPSYEEPSPPSSLVSKTILIRLTAANIKLNININVYTTDNKDREPQRLFLGT